MEQTKCEELNGEPTLNLNGHTWPGSPKSNQYDFAKFKMPSKINKLNKDLKCKRAISEMLPHKIFSKWTANFTTGSTSYIKAL